MGGKGGGEGFGLGVSAYDLQGLQSNTRTPYGWDAIGVDASVENTRGHASTSLVGSLMNISAGPIDFDVSRSDGAITISGSVFGVGSYILVEKNQGTGEVVLSDGWLFEPTAEMGLGADFFGHGLNYNAALKTDNGSLVLEEHVVFGRGHLVSTGTYSLNRGLGDGDYLPIDDVAEDLSEEFTNLPPALITQLVHQMVADEKALDGSPGFNMVDNPYSALENGGYAHLEHLNTIAGHMNDLRRESNSSGRDRDDDDRAYRNRDDSSNSTDSYKKSSGGSTDGGYKFDGKTYDDVWDAATSTGNKVTSGGEITTGGHSGNNSQSDPNDPRDWSTAWPIILDLDGVGIRVTELSESQVFVDANNDGLENRIAWAGAGNGVLFYDADGDGEISQTREFIFTEWDPTAKSDLEAIASVFDTNNDGILDATEAGFADFKVMVTKADGTFEVKTLTELGITSIDLTGNATHIELPDGSVITGQTTFEWADGSSGTVGELTLACDDESHRVEQVSATAANRHLAENVFKGYVAYRYLALGIHAGSIS